MGFEKVGKKDVGLVTGGLPEGFTILVGLVRSGSITSGAWSMVHVTKDGWEEVELELVVYVELELEGEVVGAAEVQDTIDDVCHGFKGFSVLALLLVTLTLVNWSSVLELG